MADTSERIIILSVALVYITLFTVHIPHISSSNDLAPWIDSTEYQDLDHFSIAVGTKNPSAIVSIQIYPPINSTLEFKLIRIDTIPNIISSKTISVTERMDNGVLWSVDLPDDAPATYRFGVIVHTIEGDALRLISTLRVPVQILKASLELDKSEYKIGEKPVMTIDNHGQTTLNFGTYYWYERLDEEEWVHVDWGERAWTMPMLILYPNMKYQENLDVPFSDEGNYRVGKEIKAEGTNMTRIFYADIVCEASPAGDIDEVVVPDERELDVIWGFYGVAGLGIIVFLTLWIKRDWLMERIVGVRNG